MGKIIHKIALIAGVRDIFLAFPLGGHVKVKGVEICYDTSPSKISKEAQWSTKEPSDLPLKLYFWP